MRVWGLLLILTVVVGCTGAPAITPPPVQTTIVAPGTNTPHYSPTPPITTQAPTTTPPPTTTAPRLESEVDGYNLLSPYVYTSPSEEEFDEIKKYSEHPKECLRKLSVAIMYKHSPETYKNELFSEFSVHDYIDREKGIINFITLDEGVQISGDVERQYPELEDDSLYPLLVFCEIRDENLWSNTNLGRISWARFHRSAFLTVLLDETGIEPVELANEIDEETSIEDVGYW